jgi:hypothetical protein
MRTLAEKHTRESTNLQFALCEPFNYNCIYTPSTHTHTHTPTQTLSLSRWDLQATSTLLNAYLNMADQSSTGTARSSLSGYDEAATEPQPLSMRDSSPGPLPQDPDTDVTMSTALLRRLSRVICSARSMSAAQIGGIAAAMVRAGSNVATDPGLYAHLSACACAIAPEGYTWRSLSALAQAMYEAGAFRQELRNHTEAVVQNLPASSSDALSASVLLSAMSRAGSLSASVLASIERMSIPYTPREASLMLCALARAGPRSASSSLALRMMNFAVRASSERYDCETVCQAARAYTMLEGVAGGYGGGGAGRRDALMRKIVEESRSLDWKGVSVGNMVHVLHALCMQAGAEETVARLLDALVRSKDAEWSVRDAARGINTLTKTEFLRGQEAILTKDQKVVGSLLDKLASIVLARKSIRPEDTPSVAQAAGHLPSSSAFKKPLMLAAIRAVEAACGGHGLTPSELATMANGITLENGSRDPGTRHWSFLYDFVHRHIGREGRRICVCVHRQARDDGSC